MKTNHYFIILCIILLISLLSVACKTDHVITTSSNVTATPKPIWTTDSRGRINTNDIKRLQEITPFEIIFPQYLPGDLGKYPVWLIREVVENDPNGIVITMEYINNKSEDTKWVVIEESNITSMGVSLGVTKTEFIYNETKISEVKSRNTNQEEQYNYYWDNKKISYFSRIVGFNQQEARKIVESVFK